MKTTTLAQTIAFIALAVAAQTAIATCTRADLTGTWRLYTVFDSVARCTLTMPGTGATVSTSSTCYLPGVVTNPLRGTINLTTDCHVTGSISIGAQQRSGDGWISKSKNSIAGMAWQSGDPYNGDTFTGVKQ